MLNAQTIKAARMLALQTGKAVIEVLQADSDLDTETFSKSIASLWQLKHFNMQEMHALVPDYQHIQYPESAKRKCIVLKSGEFNNEIEIFWVVLADPFDMDLQTWIQAKLPNSYELAIASQQDITALLNQHESSMRAMDDMVERADDQLSFKQNIEDLSLARISADTSHVVKLVHSTLYDALKAKVSDIHLESDAKGLVIKYRLDGVLATVAKLEGTQLAEQVLSRIKVVSELDIAERRVPQDGRFKIAIQGREVDFRVSVMPSIFGEDAVLRILDRSTITDQKTGLSLEQLGFDEETILRIRKMASEPYGMALVTGPTGSGKTTTLYAAISEINHGQDKIITIEDPVEYQLPGVLQIPVNEKKGLTFARGLRSILRHDPDKIMVGEIRDPETAQIAIQSALTGHLVFTTVHANNVFDVISRFAHMGVDPYSFVSALNGIVSQRLLRITCVHCAVTYQPDLTLLKISGLANQNLNDFDFKIGQGCGHCRGTGYRGRRAIAEILSLNDELRELIVSKQPIRQIKDAAKRNGTQFLRDVALDIVKSGITTLQEINRVTFVD